MKTRDDTMRRKSISDESYGMLEEMDMSIDDIIRVAYNMYSAIKRFTPEDTEEIAVRIGHLTITESEMEKLQSVYNQTAIDSVLSALRNYGDIKKYKSGYLTVNNWLSRRGKDALKQTGSRAPVGSKEWMEANG